jgi:hypothetical protein
MLRIALAALRRLFLIAGFGVLPHILETHLKRIIPNSILLILVATNGENLFFHRAEFSWSIQAATV